VNEALVRRLAANPKDQGRWTEFFQGLRPAVYYSAYRACRGQRDLAADVTQDAFERFIRYADLERFETDAQALAYLRQTARRLVWDALVQAHVSEAIDALPDVADPWAADRAEELELEHDVALLAKGLEGADSQLLAQLVAGASVEQIARKMDLSYGAAAVRVHRLRQKLRIRFNELRRGQ
jgi:RNA polymerase sigma factor (sigma-70 family)